jgi:hypothetical protein
MWRRIKKDERERDREKKRAKMMKIKKNILYIDASK